MESKRARSRRSTRRGILAATAVALVTMPTLVSLAQEAPAFGAVNAGAVADASRTRYSVRRFVIVENLVDTAGATAQSSMDSSESRAFAALPDPGSTVIAYNTVIGLALGQGLPVEYPFYVQSVHPGDGPHGVSDPSQSYSLAADAKDVAATARAQAGPTSGDVLISGSTASTSVVLKGGHLVATAETLTDAVALDGGAVVVRGVRSFSETVLEPGGEPKTRTEMSVGSIEASGTKFSYGPAGLTVVGTAVPVPREEADEALAATLAPFGLDARFVAPAEITGGQRAAILELEHVQSVPGSSTEAVTTLQFGGATTYAAGDVRALADGGGGEPTPGPPSVATDAAAPGTVATSEPPGSVVAEPASTGPAPTSGGTAASLSGGSVTTGLAATVTRSGSIESVYLALVSAAALASFLAVGWLRRLISARWST